LTIGAFRLHTDSQGKSDPENRIHEVGGSIPPGPTKFLDSEQARAEATGAGTAAGPRVVGGDGGAGDRGSRLSIIRASAENVHLGTVEIDDLTVRRLRVIENVPPTARRQRRLKAYSLPATVTTTLAARAALTRNGRS